MDTLNLPSFEFQVKKEGNKVYIFDVIRKKYVFLSPEEWVRQHVVHYFIKALGYPKALIKTETGLRYNTMAKRSDLLVYGRDSQAWMVVECKAPHEAIGEEALRQVSTYNAIYQCPYVAVTNGRQHFCFWIDRAEGKVERVEPFPDYPKVE